MRFTFCKYQGTGNDFILADNRKKIFPATDSELIASLCNRRLGIGADGLILLESSAIFDFHMVYFNSDGLEGSLCGNGARCITAFARKLGLIKGRAVFSASDGKHFSKIISCDKKNHHAVVELKMNDVTEIERGKNYFFLNTGSPHFVIPVESFNKLNVVEEGRKIRYGKRFSETGTNVDFILKKTNGIEMRVYERGVEDETFSSGTGAVASAIAASEAGFRGNKKTCAVKTKGGTLKVSFEKTGNVFQNIYLEGPARFVFEGELEI